MWRRTEKEADKEKAKLEKEAARKEKEVGAGISSTLHCIT